MKLITTQPANGQTPFAQDLFQSEHFSVLDFCLYVESVFISGPNSENSFVKENKEKRPEVINELQECFNLLNQRYSDLNSREILNVVLTTYNSLISKISNLSAIDLNNKKAENIASEKVLFAFKAVDNIEIVENNQSETSVDEN